MIAIWKNLIPLFLPPIPQSSPETIVESSDTDSQEELDDNSSTNSLLYEEDNTARGLQLRSTPSPQLGHYKVTIDSDTNSSRFSSRHNPRPLYILQQPTGSYPIIF